MAAIHTLITGQLRPVGQQMICVGARESPPEFAGYQAVWTASGTAALALALQVALKRRRDISRPKVLLPAYGCPDLIAAAVFSGTVPILVDTLVDDPSFDATALIEAWDDDVVAVVAVNFLGIKERARDIRVLATARRAMLIEDYAQSFPEGEMNADAIVLSFGRGKPINLLGGGGLLLRNDIPVPNSVAKPRKVYGLRLSALIFNASIRRGPYACASRLPLLRLGETRYRTLTEIRALDLQRLGRLSVNARAWLNRPRWREQLLSEGLAGVSGLIPLPVTLRERAGRLLRYPVLLRDRNVRDQALAELTNRGLGASAFYGQTLPRIQDVPVIGRAQDDFPSAQFFADRLLTLPLHDGASRKHVAEITDLLRAVRA